ASASDDKTVILWDLDSRKLLATLERHKAEVTSVAFSPDGKRLASGSEDKTLILWDVNSGKPLETLVGHKGALSGVAFSPDGKRLASASLDHTVILWETDLGVLMAEACRTANRNLTCEEWRSYIGADKPYRKTCELLPGPECD
ncbi:MAG TPA: WD40 repeat domain-containing protein, partial [Thermoanaerobaculia bacterium]|nr:WD40 repeat domain-containing protein [Thermoanaerobaculia bacterium]